MFFLSKRKAKSGKLNSDTVNNLVASERRVLEKGSGQLNADGKANILLKSKVAATTVNSTTKPGLLEKEEQKDSKRGGKGGKNPPCIKSQKPAALHENGGSRKPSGSMTDKQKITEITESVAVEKREMKDRTAFKYENGRNKTDNSPKKTKQTTQTKKTSKRTEYTVKFLKSNVSDRTWLITPDERKTYRTLDLRKANLSYIPQSVLQLRGFQAVRLSCNEELTNVRELGHMGSLKIVDLKNCGIKSFCDTGIGLNKLKALELSNNASLADFADIKTLPHLQHLSLAGCRLCAVPHEIYDLTRLQVLVLDNNPLDQSRFDISVLTELQVLLMSNCGFDSVPRSIMLLQELMYLSIANNDIKELPSALTELPTLKVINAYGNCGFSFSKPIQQGSLLKKLQVDEDFKLEQVHRKSRKIIEVWRKQPTAWWKHV